MVAFGLFQIDCFAEERPDKSRYNLFRPVPASLMREMATDRPDKTESGFTYALTRDIQLDAGVNIGLTDAADDVNPFLGLSLRY
jgi:hypothetical protein